MTALSSVESDTMELPAHQIAVNKKIANIKDDRILFLYITPCNGDTAQTPQIIIPLPHERYIWTLRQMRSSHADADIVKLLRRSCPTQKDEIVAGTYLNRVESELALATARHINQNWNTPATITIQVIQVKVASAEACAEHSFLSSSSMDWKIQNIAVPQLTANAPITSANYTWKHSNTKIACRVDWAPVISPWSPTDNLLAPAQDQCSKTCIQYIKIRAQTSSNVKQQSSSYSGPWKCAVDSSRTHAMWYTPSMLVRHMVNYVCRLCAWDPTLVVRHEKLFLWLCPIIPHNPIPVAMPERWTASGLQLEVVSWISWARVCWTHHSLPAIQEARLRYDKLETPLRNLPLCGKHAQTCLKALESGVGANATLVHIADNGTETLVPVRFNTLADHSVYWESARTWWKLNPQHPVARLTERDCMYAALKIILRYAYAGVLPSRASEYVSYNVELTSNENATLVTQCLLHVLGLAHMWIISELVERLSTDILPLLVKPTNADAILSYAIGLALESLEVQVRNYCHKHNIPLQIAAATEDSLSVQPATNTICKVGDCDTEMTTTKLIHRPPSTSLKRLHSDMESRPCTSASKRLRMEKT